MSQQDVEATKFQPERKGKEKKHCQSCQNIKSMAMLVADIAN